MVGIALLLWALSGGPLGLGPGPVEVVPAAGHLERWRSKVPDLPAGWTNLPDSGFVIQGDASMGYRPGRVLFRMEVRPDRPGKWWLQFEYPATDSVVLENRGAVSGPVGERIPRKSWKDGFWHRMALPLELREGRNRIHLLVVQTVGRQEFSARWLPDSLMQVQAEDDALRDGLVTGILMANLAAAVFLFIGIRQKYTFWYALYQSMVLLFVANDHHHAFDWLWPEFPGINQWDRAMTSIGTFGTLGMFLSSLLEFRRRWPVGGRIHEGLSASLICLAALMPLSHWFPAIDRILYDGHRIEVLEATTWLFGYALTARLAWHKSPMARGVLVALLPMVLALGVALAGELGISSRLLQVRGNLVQWSLAIENVLLNLLLLRTIRKDRERHAYSLAVHVRQNWRGFETKGAIQQL